VRPGITGLAQVNGCRGETIKANDAIARIDYDLEYIEKWSPWSDVKIIVKTCHREFLSGTGT
jgi:lipopolysaccharide/colanic/teichoic acid biosynthesis glycosyltransferase